MNTLPPEPPLFAALTNPSTPEADIAALVLEAQTAWRMLIEVLLKQNHLLLHVDEDALRTAIIAAEQCGGNQQGGNTALH